jgi:cytochrome c oxidase subunit 4
MATETAHAPGHGHAHGHDDGAVHAHVSPTILYVAIFAALITLTILTVGQSYVDLGALNIILVIAIASTKAALVATFFMHLKYDNRFNVLIFISCIFFIGVFFAYTMNDTDKRGELDPDQNVKVLPRTGEPAPGGKLVDDKPVRPPPPAGAGGAPATHH